MKRSLAFISVTLAFGTAVVVLASAAISSPQATTVKAKLVEFRIVLSRNHVPAGKVTFLVTNAGKVAHELVVIRTTKRAAALTKPGAKRAPEAGSAGEAGEMGPGTHKTLTLTLKKGHYALICNLAGHWSLGQRADFYVG